MRSIMNRAPMGEIAGAKTEMLHRGSGGRVSGRLLGGCLSPAVSVSVKNVGTTQLNNIEVNYPGGTFGIGSLAPGQTFNYQLKPTGPGNVEISWPQKNGKPVKNPGPRLNKDYKGSIQFEVGEDKYSFYADVKPK